MGLTRIAGGDCGRDDCPAIFTTDKDTVAVQGYVMHRKAPVGEAIVEIPISVLQEAARALRR
jgi:hypothetical protein